ncbi:AzlC family ABC transporter permease [Anaeromyxobacter paludicola]|uniref:Membrane protein n=1 Tax=Anaeromyxobacter paludicola TaxID=2918171 RepID=A0ABN6N9A9_9BACT|nr:AzlC family ABC transporter permease [Anaeromyxobacter paludicola]BDG09819.1 membrane protein [Anaeromyxobacter paludicola]
MQPLPAHWTRRAEFLAGCRAELPIILGVAPFGMIYGALAVGAGLSAFAAQAMSSVVFAGSAQFIAAQLIREGSPGLVVAVTVLVVNLRHLLYSASVAPYLRHLRAGWKGLLAYLLTDEAYAVAIGRYLRDGDRTDADPVSPNRHWYFLGAGLVLWGSWQVSTGVGIFLGALVPASWSLDFTLPLTFIALVFPSLRDRGAFAAALGGGGIAVLAFGLPYKLGLMLAAVGGIAVGLVADRAEREA